MAEKPNAEQRRVQEGGAAYVVEQRTQSLPLGDELLSVVRELPEEKARAVLDFAHFLNWQQTRAKMPRAEEKPKQLSLAELKHRIRQRSAELADVPREQAMVNFRQTLEEIRQEAIEKGIAINSPEELELESG